ncbi:hypothetical protein [Lacticaseibacillus parakribbianus]|nr:hypothetical protein [Lacticaseibacillus parakribbianus]
MPLSLAPGPANPFPIPGGIISPWLESLGLALLLIAVASFLILLITSRGS